MLKILVTGGCGFIGSSVIRELIRSRVFSVCNIDKLTYAGNKDSVNGVCDSSNYSFYKIDICNVKEVQEIFREYQPDYVMHLAAESHVDRSIDAPSDFIHTKSMAIWVVRMISLLSTHPIRLHHPTLQVKRLPIIWSGLGVAPMVYR